MPKVPKVPKVPKGTKGAKDAKVPKGNKVSWVKRFSWGQGILKNLSLIELDS